jgi:putative hydrolase of the HAD superfamily
MLPPSIRAVVFDAVGTVLFPDPAAADVYAETARRFGLDVSPTDLTTRFLPALAAEDGIDRAAGWVTSEVRERIRWQRIVTTVLPGASPACFDHLFAHFADPAAWRVADGAEAVFDALAARGLKLGLASNYDARLRAVLAGRPELRPLAGRVVVSAEVGVRKPGRAFFHAVEDAVGEPPGRIAFVGDDRANDFDGAVAAGMYAVLFDPADRHPAVAPRVRALAELLGPLTPAPSPSARRRSA